MIFLRVPAILAYRDLVTRAVATACKVAASRQESAFWQDPDLADQLVSAVGEAFNNAVIHAYEGKEEGTVGVEIEATAGEVVIHMQDEGKRFDLDAVPAPDLEALPESGMGLYIIRSFVDEVSYTPGSPNVLTMRKRIGA